MKPLLQLFFICLCFSAFAQKESNLIIGTYTSGKSEGIYVYKFNSANGENRFVSSIKSSNPSFVAVSPNKKYVYVVNEDGDSLNNGGAVSAYRFNKKKGILSYINQKKSSGNHPCYISFDKTGKWAIAANYSGGSFSVFAVGKKGMVETAIATVTHQGKSINKNRQEKPHVHTAVFSADNKFLLVADLGIDKLLVYRFDESNGAVVLDTAASISVGAGSGPRHIAFSPSQKYVYLTEELSGTVAAFSFSTDGKLKLMQTISAVPENYRGSLSGADIHVSPDGKFLYASNRGELNDIVIYSINDTTGILSLVGHQSCMGKKPRNFNFDPSGNFLLVANQDEGGIAVFSVNHQTGLLTDTGKRIDVDKPVCLVWD